MGGKSCYIRQVALIALMAQAGSFVPASSARLHVLDGIHTRMGASDSIQQGRSTFLDELTETSDILKKCSPRSLVIIDELGRGTSTHDGTAIAFATLCHLLQQKKCMVLFVTHYPKITDILTLLPGSAAAYHVSYLTSAATSRDDEVSDDAIDVAYLYKLVPGVSEKSFGFMVARLAQLPSSCIRRASAMAAWMEAAMRTKMAKKLEPNVSLEETREAYHAFFWNIKQALVAGDDGNGLGFLNKAKEIAEELESRHGPRPSPFAW